MLQAQNPVTLLQLPGIQRIYCNGGLPHSTLLMCLQSKHPYRALLSSSNADQQPVWMCQFSPIRTTSSGQEGMEEMDRVGSL